MSRNASVNLARMYDSLTAEEKLRMVREPDLARWVELMTEIRELDRDEHDRLLDEARAIVGGAL